MLKLDNNALLKTESFSWGKLDTYENGCEWLGII